MSEPTNQNSPLDEQQTLMILLAGAYRDGITELRKRLISEVKYSKTDDGYSFIVTDTQIELIAEELVNSFADERVLETLEKVRLREIEKLQV